MLHLAQVQTTDPGGKTALQLLAQQTSEFGWIVLPVSETIVTFLNNCTDCQEGALILVELSDTGETISTETATTWVLNLIEQYLNSGITPSLLEQEAQRAEQWRQSLTLQSQELGRRSLEMEARRDQIQDLEENLKKEKKQLELMAADMETRWSQLRDAEELLKRERKQLDALAAELSLKTNSNSSAN